MPDDLITLLRAITLTHHHLDSDRSPRDWHPSAPDWDIRASRKRSVPSFDEQTNNEGYARHSGAYAKTSLLNAATTQLLDLLPPSTSSHYA